MRCKEHYKDTLTWCGAKNNTRTHYPDVVQRTLQGHTNPISKEYFQDTSCGAKNITQTHWPDVVERLKLVEVPPPGPVVVQAFTVIISRPLFPVTLKTDHDSFLFRLCCPALMGHGKGGWGWGRGGGVAERPGKAPCFWNFCTCDPFLLHIKSSHAPTLRMGHTCYICSLNWHSPV